MLICRNCGNSGRDMFGNVCPCQKHRMKGRAMYAVFYRLGGYEETWREAPDTPLTPYRTIQAADEAAITIQSVLRHVGYPYAQAEVREVDAPAVEGGHGETLPAKCGFCTSTVWVCDYDMGEGRHMLLCVDCRANIKRGREIMG